MNWIKLNGNGVSLTNYILDFPDFYISYNPDTRHPLMPFFNGENIDETALTKKGDRNEFYILNGDFRKEYEKIAPKGYSACKRFFNSKKKEFGSSWGQ